MESATLLQHCKKQTEEIRDRIAALKTLDEQTLNRKPDPDSWSILECIEHLNLYGDYYLPQIEQRIAGSKSKPDATFSPGLLGDYFAKSMLPKEKLNKMKTFKDKNPVHTGLRKDVLEKSIQQQNKLLQLLEAAEQVNLSKVRIPTSIASWLRLKLGDTFRFYVNHMIRHMAQAERVLQNQPR